MCACHEQDKATALFEQTNNFCKIFSKGGKVVVPDVVSAKINYGDMGTVAEDVAVNTVEGVGGGVSASASIDDIQRHYRKGFG